MSNEKDTLLNFNMLPSFKLVWIIRAYEKPACRKRPRNTGVTRKEAQSRRMKGHNLMQSIARVNRVHKDKPGGLVVDYHRLDDQGKRESQVESDCETDPAPIWLPA